MLSVPEQNRVGVTCRDDLWHAVEACEIVAPKEMRNARLVEKLYYEPVTFFSRGGRACERGNNGRCRRRVCGMPRQQGLGSAPYRLVDAPVRSSFSAASLRMKASIASLRSTLDGAQATLIKRSAAWS